MTRRGVGSDTDGAWEEWGRRDPYFAVITNPKYRRGQMQESSKREFFDSGQWHVDYIMKTIHDHLDSQFKPHSILDFGCGVGRTLIGFSRVAQDTVGMDVAPSMLLEAQRNCAEHGVTNVKLVLADDALTEAAPSYSLIHSCIVFQHIPPARGRSLFRELLAHMAPRGIGAIQMLYSKSQYASTYGIPPAITPGDQRQKARNPDPEIQMNPYSMTEVLFLMQNSGIRRFYADFTDHGGELGIFLFFQAN